MKIGTLIAISVAAALSAPVAAQTSGGPASSAGATPKEPSAEMFTALDKNKDGQISVEEAKGSPYEKEFAKLDKNRDGKLSRSEHAVAHAGGKADKSAAGSTPSADTGGVASSSRPAPGGSSGGSRY